MSDYHVGVMLLAHRRPWLLPLIVEQCLSEFKSFVDITVDRPSADVLRVVDELSGRKGVRVFEAPRPCLVPGPGGDHFMAVRQFQLEKLQEKMPNYGCLMDDDAIFEHPAEARRWMAKRFDLIYAKKRYLWDNVYQYNANMFEHCSVHLFKMLEGDRFPEVESGRIIQAPLGVHDGDDSTKVTMSSFLLDIGTIWKEERERVFRAYAASGKVDGATLPLVQPPLLKKVKEIAGRKGFWLKQIEKRLACLSHDQTL